MVPSIWANQITAGHWVNLSLWMRLCICCDMLLVALRSLVTWSHSFITVRLLRPPLCNQYDKIHSKFTKSVHQWERLSESEMDCFICISARTLWPNICFSLYTHFFQIYTELTLKMWYYIILLIQSKPIWKCICPWMP